MSDRHDKITELAAEMLATLDHAPPRWAKGARDGTGPSASGTLGSGELRPPDEAGGAVAGSGTDTGDATFELAALDTGATIKHYEVVRPLGRGGMGAVYLARDPKLGRLVAIKVLSQRGDRGARRFLDEARATAQCKHENIVVIHEVDEVDGLPYMVLEYLEGRTLRDWLAGREAAPGARTRPEPVPPGQAVELVLPVVRALSCAHGRGIVHRDLKPANIFLTDDGIVKVLDFGIAKRLGAGELSALAAPDEVAAPAVGLTGTGAMMGTLPYMAPEQWRNEPVDARTDLWAVGILLFRLVAGAHPLAPIGSPLQLVQVGVLDVPMPSVFERRPDLGPLGAVVDRCLKKRREERFGSADELLAALEPLLPGRRWPAPAGDQSPFAGLAAFQEADAGRFYGREREVAEALGRLRHQPLVAVVGASGAGKSSFVRAGVIPAFKRAYGSSEGFVVRPGRRPLAALAELLATGPGGEGGADVGALTEALRSQPGLLGAHLRERCRGRGPGHRAALFVDQFEELYTLGAGADERAAFVACLEGVADDASSPLRVLLSLRSDFLDRAAEARHFAAELTRGLMLLPPLGSEALREALVRPVEASGYRFEGDDVAGDMLDALAHARTPLPLLQFTAARLWEARDRARRLLTREGYERVGGVAGALSAHADAVLASLAPSERPLARAVLLRLVTPERTRAVVGLDELRAHASDGDAVEQVVRRLADARLVLVELAEGREGAKVELVHESLIERWATLRGWLDESVQDAHFLARLRAAAGEWGASGEAEGLLWRDRAAANAVAWLARRGDEPGEGPFVVEREERYLQAVAALHERTRRRRRRALAALVAGLVVVSVLVSLLALRAEREATRAGREAGRAHDEAARADRSAAFARNAARLAAARELQPTDPTTALALLREVEPPALPPAWGERAFVALHGAVSSAVLPHPVEVRAAAFSPDGRRVATASQDGAVRVFGADGAGEPLVLRGHVGQVLWVAWSPDGSRLVSASRDKTARVWPADGAGEPVVLRHEGDVYRAVFSPDGRRVATASKDGAIRVFGADGAREPLVLRGHGGPALVVSWSPDGRRLVSASRDKTLRVWPADGAGKAPTVHAYHAIAYAASFSPDGRRIVTAGDDRVARVWDADALAAGRATRPLYSLRGYESEIFGAVFSPDGRRVVTAAGDGTARVWAPGSATEPLVLRGHRMEVYAASFSPDGRHVVTASRDHTARIWDADGGGAPLTLRGSATELNGCDFSSDGRRVTAASRDKTARVWNADGSGEPVVLRGHAAAVYASAFSPDGRQIATASVDQTVRVWNADGSGRPLVLRGHDGPLYAVTWSPDGRRLVSASRDKTARVWPADGSGEPVILRGHEGEVTSAAFSPDGRRVVTSSDDRT
ncbi:MAG: protein kinase, partial [Polyangiaceae bacterium]|nr:protein kinase [Polyangiaceae bacterium]